MPEEAHSQLLPRKEMAAAVAEVFAGQLSLLEELVNYGSNLIPRCFGPAAERGIHDATILYNFVKQGVTCLDGVHLAASAGSGINAVILLRGAFEIRVYLEWIFQKDTIFRGTLAYVADIRTRRLWLLRALPGTPENISFLARMKHKDLKPNLTQVDPDLLKQEIAERDALLASDAFRAVNARFESVKGADRNWYRAGEVNNLADMAKEAGIEAEHTAFYGWFSRLTHGNALNEHLKITPGSVPDKADLTASPIRDVVGVGEVFQMSFNMAMQIYRLTLRHYRPTEEADLNRRFGTEWRERYWSIPKVVRMPDGQVRVTPTAVPPFPGSSGMK